MADYDRIGSSDPIGRVECGYNRKGKNYLLAYIFIVVGSRDYG